MYVYVNNNKDKEIVNFRVVEYERGCVGGYRKRKGKREYNIILF